MSDIITVKEGKDKLALLEAMAIEHFHNSRDAFNDAMRALYQISKEGLWEYAVDIDGVMLRDYTRGGSFEAYLGWFCTKHGVSRSSVQQHLKTSRTWDRLGRPMDELLEIGIKRAGPHTDLVKYDARNDKIEIPPREVIDSLPPLEPSSQTLMLEEEFVARVNLLIDEVLVLPPVPLTDRDVRKAFTIDVDTGKSEINFFENDEGDVWFTYETGDDFTDGTLLYAKHMDWPDAVREKVMKRLRVILYN